MLFDRTGHRKYLIASEWRAFLTAAEHAQPAVRSFCFVLAYTGARLSEVRALTPLSVDIADCSIAFECLKRRQAGIYRSVPVPSELIALLETTHQLSLARSDPLLSQDPIWHWSRTTAWKRVKEVCEIARIPREVSMPKAFRHSFGVEGTARAHVPIGVIKRWLGHARLESTIIYCEAVGPEEKEMASRMWRLP